MLPSLNVSLNMVLAQQTADEAVAADSSFMFYLFKLSVLHQRQLSAEPPTPVQSAADR